MRFFAWFLLLVFLVAVFAAKKKATPKSKSAASSSVDDANKRLEILADKLRVTPLISLTDGNYSKFVVDRPRDYRAILMFTATDPRYQCAICGKALGLFEDVAKLYNSQYNFTEAPISERVVFFRLEVDNARSVFGDLGLETVPKVYSLPAASASTPRSNIHQLEIDARPFMEGVSTAMSHVNENAGLNVRVSVFKLLLTHIHYLIVISVCYSFVFC
jgi:hypothetical protein